MARRRWPYVVLCIFALIAPLGCGSDGDEGGDPPTTSISADGSAGGQTTKSGAAAVKAGSSRANQQPATDPLHPVVAIETTQGTIQVELDAVNAPGTVRNFLNYIAGGYYEGTIFHYVKPDGMILGGGFDAELQPKDSLPPIRNEAHNGLKNVAGTIAMSRQYDAIDSATSQFFINLADNPALDHQNADMPDQYGYCVFGTVTEGIEVAQRIADVEVEQSGDMAGTPKQAVVIKSVKLLR